FPRPSSSGGAYRGTVRASAAGVNADRGAGKEGGSERDFSERLHLRLGDILLPFQAAEFDEQGVAFGAGSASYLLAQAREIALDDLQLRLDRAAVELVRWQRLIGEHGAALRRHLGNAADDEDAPGDPLPLVNVDRPG